MVYNQEVFMRLPQLAEDFRTALPFKHIVIDSLFNDELLQRVAAEFYPLADSRWQHFSNDREGKLAVSNSEHNLPPTIRDFVRELNAETFLTKLSALTGIPGLIADPYLIGGGMHCIPRGGKLEIHADFNKHPLMQVDRRLNLLIYLNKDWQESYGGHLELWDRPMLRCVQRVLPIFNRTVLFLTDDFSFHGHPEPLECPAGFARKSIAMYYYTNGRPAEELRAVEEHDTLFQERPHDRCGDGVNAPSSANPGRKSPVSFLSALTKILKGE